MNKTLRAMIAKHAHTFGPEWDIHLQQLLFAYRVKPQESTQTTLSQPMSPYREDLDDYRSSLAAGLSEAWRNASQHIKEAQQSQKDQYDKRAREPKLKVGDRVMVFMPSEVKGKKRKLALPHQGPYRILDITTTGASVRPVDCPKQQPIFVNLSRVTKCPKELPDTSWRGKQRTYRRRSRTVTSTTPSQAKHGYSLRRKGLP